MPTALVAGPFSSPDPASQATLDSLSRALPGWETVAVASRTGIARALRGADAAILTGQVLGETGADADGPDAATALTLLAASRALGRPTALLGIGAGPLRNRRQRALARRLVQAADLLILRDDVSARHLELAGAQAPFRVGADPAWLALGGGAEATPSADGAAANGGAPAAAANSTAPGAGRERSVLVALDRRACGAAQVPRLASALAGLAQAGVEVRLQPWHRRDAEGRGDRDHAVAAELASRLQTPVRMLEPLADLRSSAAALAGCGVALCVAPHALISAAAAAIPAVALDGCPGVASLARRLEQPLLGPDATAAEIAAAVLGSLERDPAPEAAKRREIAAAEEGLRLLRLLLSEGESEDSGEISGLSLKPGAQA
jgi:polysaccharide pyruvyl transferase WcaK-like protein